MKYYVLHIEGDVDPRLVGPFNRKVERDDEAKSIRAQGSQDVPDGLYKVDAESAVTVEAYTGGVLDWPTYDEWFRRVQEELWNIGMGDGSQWQQRWLFDFPQAYSEKLTATRAAMAANRFWWYSQNKALDDHCLRTPACWLPAGHSRECEPVR